MALEDFQSATVAAAEAALRSETGSRRFLVADEVGLGKTVVARELSRRLADGRSTPLNVVYFCPSLAIASQNLKKLRALQPDWPSPADRLSLAREPAPRVSPTWRIFAYTPETSLPGWKAGGRRTGRWAEREFIASLVRVFARRTWRELRRRDRARGALLFPESPSLAENGLARRAAAAFRVVFDLGRSDLDGGLLEALRRDDVWEFVLKARCALALVALRDSNTRPDLLILDEFHRYADLVLPAPRGGRTADQVRVHELLRSALLGEDGRNTPAVLLMSATPYRLRRADGGMVAGGRYENFVALVRFLFGPHGTSDAERAEAAIREHHAVLGAAPTDRDAALEAVRAAKRRVEAALVPVVARTERATTIRGELFRRRELVGDVEAADLSTFGHMAAAVARTERRLSSWVPPLWSSVPYPAETLFGYRVSTALTSPCAVRSGAAGSHFDHPRLRACTEGRPAEPPAVDRTHLSLPWCPPTRPWWPLAGAWKRASRAGFGKALLFSRFTGTPPAVAALLSRDAEGTKPARGAGAAKFAAQAYLKATASPSSTIAAFLPLATLSGLVEVGPISGRGGRPRALARASRSLERALKERVELIDTAPISRPIWRLAVQLEAALGGTTLLEVALGRLRGLRERADGLGAESLVSPGPVGRDELSALCSWLVSAPGPVVARTLMRHQPAALREPKLHAVAFEFCWGRLRTYLGQRYFAGPILSGGDDDAERFPVALRRAVLDGGLEAVLDEHLATMARVGEGTPLDHLAASLVGRPGHVRLRGRAKTGRVHAAAPFAGAERRGGRGGRDAPLRSEALRKAFNGPFWPHVLVTTSVGQEGLDFHVWCDRVIHWDLPGDPVDFEQREGRVARYGSLAVRRALAAKFRPSVRGGAFSPFAGLFAEAADSGEGTLGLEKWWAPLGEHRPKSFTFATDFSLEARRAQSLKAELARYRLALGQPEPDVFVELVRHFGLGPEEARSLALDLSPSSRRGGGGSERSPGKTVPSRPSRRP